MDIEQVIDNGIEIVYPVDRIDTVTSKEFEKYMIDAIGRSKKIIISFSKINYISSAGLRIMLMSAKQIKSNGGSLCLCDMAARVVDVFKMSGFDKILSIVATVDDAKQVVLAKS